MIEDGFDRNQGSYFEAHYYPATLFTSKGTQESTVELVTGLSMPEVVNAFGHQEFLVEDDIVYFYTEGRSLWKSNLTPEGTVSNVDTAEEEAIKSEFSNLDSNLMWRSVMYQGSSYRTFPTEEGDYFVTNTKIVVRRERADGRGVSFFELVDFGSLDIVPVRTSFRERTVLVEDGVVYFSARHPDSGAELWQSDGTIEGTRIVADIMPGPGDSDATLLGTSDGVVYFMADDGIHGRELWAVSPGETVDPSDLNSDGAVDFADFLVLSENYGRTADQREEGDLDGSGLVDFADFLLFAAEFKKQA